MEKEEMEMGESEVKKKYEREDFPIGLRVLAVDDDIVCLKVLEALLKKCGYEVTTCQHAQEALQLLRKKRDKYDIVITDVHMPGMDGFKLLEIIGLEMDLPVIMLSVSSDVRTVMKGIQHGACDYLVKPVRLQELMLIWKHVVKKSLRDAKETNDNNYKPPRATKLDDDRTTRLTRKEHEADDNYSVEDAFTQKKPRVTWNHDLHKKFINAVHRLGVDRAVPKRILEYMDTPGITRENVASHLQKYRKALRTNKMQMNQQGYGDGGLDGFRGNPPKSMAFSFDGQASDNIFSFKRCTTNGYINYPNSSPFNYTQGPPTAQPWTPLSIVHRENLCQPYAGTSQFGNVRMQHLGHGSNHSLMQTVNSQSNFNELGNQSFMRRPNQLDGSMVNASQNVRTNDGEPGMTSLLQLGSAVKENPIDVLFDDNTFSQNGDLKDSFPAQSNALLMLPNENYNYDPYTGANLDWGTQKNGDSFEMQSCKGEHIKVSSHPEFGMYPVEQPPTGATFHLRECDSEDDLHSALKQFQQ